MQNEKSIFTETLTLREQYPFLKTRPELEEFVRILRIEAQCHKRPAEQTVLLDEHVMQLLGVSKRKLEYMKANRELPFFNPPMQRDYFLLSDILDWLKKYKVQAIGIKF
jgi:hypothetical protein